MYRPIFSNFNNSALEASGVAARSLDRRAPTGKIVAGYFGSWGIYGREYSPDHVPASQLTHILYAFADICAGTGQVIFTDDWADKDKHYPSDSWDETGENLYGNLKQLYLLKKANRHLKTILSIGGWTYSQDGHFDFVTDATARAEFVASSLEILEDYGFDGVDLYFEYPSAGAQAKAFVSLLAELRKALDAHALKKGDTAPYQLSVAVPTGPDTYRNLLVKEMAQYVDLFNIMAYDFAGSWSSLTGDQANLYGSPISGDAAIQWYISQGASSSQLNLGIPLYGSGFTKTNGLNKAFSGVGTGTWESGVYDYWALPRNRATIYQDLTGRGTSWSYDASAKELINYDTPAVAALKAQYVKKQGLAGVMFWELSGDKTGSESIISTVSSVFTDLDQTPNHLSYPGSTFDNMRGGMGTQVLIGVSPLKTSATTITKAATSTTQPTKISSTLSSTVTPKTSLSLTTSLSSNNSITLSTTSRCLSSSSPTPMTTSHSLSSSSAYDSTIIPSTKLTSTMRPMTSSTTTSTKATVTSSTCQGYVAWHATWKYWKGSRAIMNGKLYRAQWYNLNEKPGSRSGVWQLKGSC